MELIKNTPIYFKKLVQTESTSPNADYIGFKEKLPKSEAHKILWKGEEWIVGRDQFRTRDEAMSEAAKRFDAEISKATETNPKHPELVMGISRATLKKRIKFVQQHLVNGEVK